MDGLKASLAQQLPKNAKFNLFYVQSKPAYVKPLVNVRKSLEERPSTIKIRHFFNLIDAAKDVIVFGIEIVVYLTFQGAKLEQNVFVSKCDTVGLFNHNVRIGPVVKVLLDWVILFDLRHYNLKTRKEMKKESTDSLTPSSKEYNIFKTDTLVYLEKISEKLASGPEYYSSIKYYNKSTPHKKESSDSKSLVLPPHQTIKISLFAKAAQQYLFPSSFKNKNKHVVNGVKLLEWWLRVIDQNLSGKPGAQCKLLIPGLAEQPTSKFLTNLSNSWTVGHIFNASNLAIYNIPLFPDDPKGRFLEHLIVENNYQKMENDRFYEELGCRQEFRLGDVVGLIGAQIDGVPILKNEPNEEIVRNIISIRDYKQLVNLLKSEHYNIESDVRELVISKIPEFCNNKNFEHEEYIELTGTKEFVAQQKSDSNPVVNTLTVRKRSKGSEVPKVNNLTNLVKRKKKAV
ncbi:regulator of Ty1 transposition [Suhomyces tanzawaensis NRRL Y-17324]|uniref:histone acetyltransferase n=1 Tax=Suhomyces tanzawaensis NRRL Y-17324 TaxID=984487 RepID=A0A1E4SCG4_9ASCO|nr:regulator of Ty1 transposition [Suhomyces tanzawaensis NRRL Y-17324]ODV77211.1 regulator of Ty1 transposition [Suhomyces tanzawaensis NRRL Y-17324]